MEAIGTLAGGVAHDFNNILYMISGNAELALEDLPDGNPVYKNIMEIKEASLRAAGIVKQLLNFSRKADQELKPVDGIAIIKDAVKFLRSTIPSTIRIVDELPRSQVVIMGDAIQLNQILMNLFGNASHAMKDKGGDLFLKVTKEKLDHKIIRHSNEQLSGEYLKISISDTGTGIGEDTIHHIFDPYFTTKEVGEGSGMGLSVVHGLVKNHGGAITVDSQVGKGSTFTIYIPVIHSKAEDTFEDVNVISGGSERVLVVDDEPLITNLVQRILTRLGYLVTSRCDPVEALDLFTATPDQFDMVITDMTMPSLTGVAFSKKTEKGSSGHTDCNLYGIQ